MTKREPHQAMWWVRVLPRVLRSKLLAETELARVLDNMGWLFVDKALRLVLGVIVGVWVARYLQPAGFGDLNFALALVAMVGILAGLGLSSIVVRDLVREPRDAQATMASALVLQSAGCLAGLVLLAALAAWYGLESAQMRALILVLSLVLLFRVSDVAKYWMEATLQSKYAVWVENGALLIGAGIRVLLITSGAGVVAFAWAALLEIAVSALGLLVGLRLLGGHASIIGATRRRAGELLRDAWPLFIAAAAVTLYMRVDMLMLRHFRGSEAVGVYAAATKISELFYMIPMVIVSSVLPSIIRSHRDDRQYYQRQMERLYGVLAWLAVGFSLPVALNADFIITALFGKSYEAAGPILAVHMWGSVAVFAGVASSQHLLVEGKQVLSLWRTMLGLVCNVVLNIIFIPWLGSVGAAVATVISYFVATYSLALFQSTRRHSLLMLGAPIVLIRNALRRA